MWNFMWHQRDIRWTAVILGCILYKLWVSCFGSSISGLLVSRRLREVWILISKKWQQSSEASWQELWVGQQLLGNWNPVKQRHDDVEHPIRVDCSIPGLEEDLRKDLTAKNGRRYSSKVVPECHVRSWHVMSCLGLGMFALSTFDMLV